MKTKLLTIVGSLLLIACAGCGAAGAPPVDLPAPITGRVDVSAPDDAGNIAITGTEGAVDGSVLVMAVDETGSGVISLRLLDLLISPAYAAGESFPPICDTAWHACSYAAADGSFTIYLKASIGDAIAIGVIDPVSGYFISELLRVTVPESGTPDPAANCSGQGVSGQIADLAIAPSTGTPLLLRQGNDAQTNTITIGAGSGSSVAITGCHAYGLAVIGSLSGDIVVATSKEDKVLWAGRLVNGVLRDRRSFQLADEPMHAAFTENQSAPIVAMGVGATVELHHLSLADNTALKSIAIDRPPPAMTRSTALRMMQMEGTEALGLLVTDSGDPTDAYVTLFKADKLARSYTVAMNDLSSMLLSIVDAWIYVDDWTEKQIRFAVLDSASTENAMRRFSVQYDAGGIPKVLTLLDSFTLFTEWRLPAPAGTDNVAAGKLRRIVTTEVSTSTPTRALISKGDLHLYYKQNIAVDGSAELTWPGSADITLMAISQANKKLFGVDAATGQVTDGSILLTW